MKTLKSQIVEAIVDFEQKAIELVILLAEKLSIDLHSEHAFTYSEIKEKRKGALNNEWTYWFHGGHCDFENQTTKQYLHVGMYGAEKYRTIDYYYLYKFIQTTESLSGLYKAINSEENFYKLLIELEQDGVLINILEAPVGSPFKLIVRNRQQK